MTCAGWPSRAAYRLGRRERTTSNQATRRARLPGGAQQPENRERTVYMLTDEGLPRSTKARTPVHFPGSSTRARLGSWRRPGRLKRTSRERRHYARGHRRPHSTAGHSPKRWRTPCPTGAVLLLGIQLGRRMSSAPQGLATSTASSPRRESKAATGPAALSARPPLPGSADKAREEPMDASMISRRRPNHARDEQRSACTRPAAP